MVVEWIASLALSGGTVLVNAMAEDGWQAVRDKCANLFRHRGDERAAELLGQLDDDAAEVASAGAEDRPELRQDLADTWRVRLRDLLKAHPEAREELAALVESAPRNVQRNEARDGGVIFAVQDGQQHVTYYGGGS